MSRVDKALQRTAHHEAGHAVMRIALGYPATDAEVFDAVHMTTKGLATGYSHGSGVAMRGEDIAVVCMAGSIAEARAVRRNAAAVMLMSGEADWDEARAMAASWAEALAPAKCAEFQPPTAEELMSQWERKASDLVREHWPAITRVAAALITRSRLTGVEVQELADLT